MIKLLWRYIISAALLVSLAVVLFIMDCKYPYVWWIEAYAPSIAGGIVAAVVAFLGIELASVYRERSRKQRLTILATARLHVSMRDLLLMFLQMWKAAIKQKPDHLPANYIEFLSGAYYEEYAHFNLRTTAPIMPEVTWYSYFNDRIDGFKKDVDGILHSYVGYLDYEFIEMIERVTRHNYMKFGQQLLAKEILEEQGKIKDCYVGECSILADDLFAKLLELVSYINNEVRLDFSIDQSIYRDDVSPRWANGYVELVKLEESKP